MNMIVKHIDRYPDIHEEIGGNDCNDANVADNAKEHWKFKGSPEGRIPGKLIKHPNVGNIYGDDNKIQLNSSNTPGYNFVDFSIDFNDKGWMMKGTEMCVARKSGLTAMALFGMVCRIIMIVK